MPVPRLSRSRWLLPAALAALLAVRLGFTRLLASDWQALEHGPVLCPFRLLTGVPCPGCGMTRAVVALAMGEWSRAWAYNPLALSAAAILLGVALLAWLPPALRDRPYGWLQRPGVSRSALVIVLAVWVWRLG